MIIGLPVSIRKTKKAGVILYAKGFCFNKEIPVIVTAGKKKPRSRI
jgi:hypothetical protein